jgi:hypothetical protein
MLKMIFQITLLHCLPEQDPIHLKEDHMLMPTLGDLSLYLWLYSPFWAVAAFPVS